MLPGIGTARQRPLLPAAVLAAGLLAAVPGEVAAQRTTALTVGGGATLYDLSGVGTSWAAGAEFSTPVGELMLAEAGGRIFRYESQAGRHVTHVFPSAGLYLDVGGRDFRVYTGGGLGLSLVPEGRGDTDLTLHAAGGFRVRIRPRWLVRPEIRVRSVDPWVGTTGEFTVGVTYRFGADTGGGS